MEFSAKTPEIRAICSRINDELGDAVRFNSYWDDSPDAVGISHPFEPRRLAYICSYPDGYFVSLELPPSDDSDRPFEAAGDYNGLNSDQVLDVVRTHLNVRLSDA